MSRLYINATKSFGDKLQNGVEIEGVSGIYYSIAEITNKFIDKIEQIDNTQILASYPFYYLLYSSYDLQEYILGDDNCKEGTNRILCLLNNLENLYGLTLPINVGEFVQKSELIFESIHNYYDKFYGNSSYFMSPSMIIENETDWKIMVLNNILADAQKYAENNNKDYFIGSFIISTTFLDNSNVSGSLLKMVDLYPKMTTMSININIDNDEFEYYTPDRYKKFMVLLYELKYKKTAILLHHCGIRDVLFSIFDIDSYSVGWFNTYRGFTFSHKRIGITVKPQGGGRNVKKILLSKVFSEIPLAFYVKLPKEIQAKLGYIISQEIEKTQKDLELIYWQEYLKMITLSSKSPNYIESIVIRAQELNRKLSVANILLHDIIAFYDSVGLFNEAARIKSQNLDYVTRYLDALQSFMKEDYFW